MNKVYKRILNEYGMKPVFIQKFKSAQRSWLRFRDSHLNSLYPEQNKTREYGTAYSDVILSRRKPLFMAALSVRVELF